MTMAASPAEVVRSVLVSAGLVVPPAGGREDDKVPYDQTPGDGSTVCYTRSLPDEPDQVVFVANRPGVNFGRCQRTGRLDSHPGVSILVRSLGEDGRSLAVAVATALDEFKMSDVKVGDETHYVQSVYRTSDVIDVGEEMGNRRQLWSINARVAFQDKENFVG